MNGLLQYPIAESTGRSTENIDSIIARNQVDALNEQYKLHGAIGPNPSYDEDGNIIPITGYPPDIALSPFITKKGLMGLLGLAKKEKDVFKLYRGVEEWIPREMVKDRKFIGQGRWAYTPPSVAKHQQSYGLPELRSKALWTSESPEIAHMYAAPGPDPGRRSAKVLEFIVPKDYLSRYGINAGNFQREQGIVFPKGLPKEFLSKVKTGDYHMQNKGMDLKYGK